MTSTKSRNSTGKASVVNAIRTFTVEAGLPTLEEARRLVIEELKRAKREGVKVLKVIHASLHSLPDLFDFHAIR